MKVMVMVKASPSSEAGVMPDQQLLTEMGNYNEELVKAGIMVAGEGLHPSSKGVRVHFSGKDRTVIDGPFAETKELVAGFWIWQVNSLQEAIDWVKRCPNPMLEPSDIEIRQIFTADDFGSELTPELREQEASLRAQTLGLGIPRFEQSAARNISGLNQTYTFENRSDIPQQWHQFAPQIGTVPGQLGGDSYGVCWNYQPGRGFDYLTGVEVRQGSPQPAGFQQVQLPAGRYAVFTHQGNVSTIPTALEKIWSQWLPDSGFQAAQSPSFERYTPEFNPETGSGGIEFWVPLQ